MLIVNRILVTLIGTFRQARRRAGAVKFVQPTAVRSLLSSKMAAAMASRAPPPKAGKQDEVEDVPELPRYPSPPPHLTHASRGIHVRNAQIFHKVSPAHR